jgi:hypothetical protein
MENFNKLTPAETERLAILMEECAEVQQIVGKILRHGYESYDPTKDNPFDNRGLLELELGDLKHIVFQMQQVGDVNSGAIHLRVRNRSNRINKYTHHNDFEKIPPSTNSTIAQ